MTAKGLSMPTIHVYSNDMETARRQAVDQYFRVIEDLRDKGLPIASPDLKTCLTIVLMYLMIVLPYI